jgi:ectoine hydroxylase-related dioxygenase (phytanoyl-CoA dioxygenase family)
MAQAQSADSKGYTLGAAPPRKAPGSTRTSTLSPAERAAALPPATRDIEQAKRDIAEYGICIVADVLTPDQLARARKAFYHAAEEDRARGQEQKFGLDYAEDDSNQRVWNLLSRDPIFSDLVEHPIALELVKSVLGWPALLGNISGNLTGPGGGEMVLHADQIFVPEPWPSEPQGFNVAWCLDDFTEANGATRIVPRSHLRHTAPTDADQDIDTVPLEAPAGTMVAFESRLWHKTGNNVTQNERRAGAFAWYTRPIYRAQENWFLSLDPRVRQFASDDMLVLLGYKADGLGLVNGTSPA